MKRGTPKTRTRSARSSAESALRRLPKDHEYGQLRERIEDTRKILEDLAFVEAFAPHLIATGALDPQRDDGLLSIGYMVASQRFDLAADVAKLAQADKKDLEAQAYPILGDGLLAGYLLGLAVGMRLSPGALRGEP